MRPELSPQPYDNPAVRRLDRRLIGRRRHDLRAGLASAVWSLQANAIILHRATAANDRAAVVRLRRQQEIAREHLVSALELVDSECDLGAIDLIDAMIPDKRTPADIMLGD